MELTQDLKKELRKKIEEKLQNVPEGQRIYLDKELLEQLIFDEYTEVLNGYSGKFAGNRATIKYIVWSGPFLSKIDLSEVSFDDVVWSVGVEYIDLLEDDRNRYYDSNVKQINLSNTNAKIDFSKSFDAKHRSDGSDVDIDSCDFSNVDLSNNNLGENYSLSNSNFSNTGLRLDLNHLANDNGFYGGLVYNCDFSGLDFSGYTINDKFFCTEHYYCDDDICKFTNTGVHISLHPIGLEIMNLYTEIENTCKQHRHFRYNNLIYVYENMIYCHKKLIEKMKLGYFDGCYINGKLIRTADERQRSVEEQKQELEKIKESLISITERSVEKQNDGITRK